MTLTEQFITIFAMICVGLFIGISYDTFLRFSRYWKQHFILSFMLEIAFWFTQTFILFFVLLDVHDGQLRWYVFVACLLGISIYYVALQRMYRYVLEKVILIIRTMIKYFVFVPILTIYKICFFLIKKVYSVCYILLTIVFAPVIWLGKLFYQFIPEKVRKSINKLREFYCIIKIVAKKSWYWLCTKFSRGE